MSRQANMRLQLMTWPEVEHYLESRRDVIVPIGSTEQHGPTGLIGTDALTADAIAIRLGETVGAVVAPCLSIGMAHHHLAFKGTMTLRPTTLIAVVQDVVASLARHGFQRVLFVNGHGGNIATVNTAIQEIHAAASLAGMPSPVTAHLASWWDGPRVKGLSRELYGSQEGSHATASEVSVTWALHPDRVQDRVLYPQVAPSNGPWTDALDYRARHPDGRIGSNPALSRPEHGERLMAAAVEDLAERYRPWAGLEGGGR